MFTAVNVLPVCQYYVCVWIIWDTLNDHTSHYWPLLTNKDDACELAAHKFQSAIAGYITVCRHMYHKCWNKTSSENNSSRRVLISAHFRLRRQHILLLRMRKMLKWPTHMNFEPLKQLTINIYICSAVPHIDVPWCYCGRHIFPWMQKIVAWEAIQSIFNALERIKKNLKENCIFSRGWGLFTTAINPWPPVL